MKDTNNSKNNFAAMKRDFNFFWVGQFSKRDIKSYLYQKRCLLL